eukprot:m.123638 g.123638  ORF g.123638 m.123638 type:complete len:301 (+) comp37827_c1_seq1:72-974(+)
MSRGDFGSQRYGAVSTQEPSRVDLGLSSSGSSYQSFEAFKDFGGRCQKVSNSIQAITAKTSQMEKLLRQVGTSSDALGLRHRLSKLRIEVQHAVAGSASAVKQLERDVRSSSGAVQRTDVIRFERLKTEYSDCVKRYQKALTATMEAERTSLPPHVLLQGRRDGSSLVQEDDYENQNLMDAEQRRQEELEHLQRQEQIVDFHETEIEEREEAIRTIESDMVEVNEIFRDLGTLVHEQGEQIDLIETHITTTKGRVEDGTQQLRKAKEYQKKARTKMCCLLIVILIIAAVLAIIIYFSVEK